MKTALYWGMTVLGGISIVLVGVNAVLFTANQRVQAEVNQRQQYIAQTAQLNRFYEPMLHMLGEVEANTHDDQVRTMLLRHGLIKPSPAVAPPADGAKPAPGK